MKISELVNYLKDIIFPVNCVGCGQEGEWWCDHCLSESLKLPVKMCPVCHRPTSQGEVCSVCLSQSYLDGTVALFVYQENSSVGKLIKQFKYSFVEDIKIVWEKIINHTDLVLPFKEDFVIIPVPLHIHRHRERGFNQAEIISLILASQTGATVDNDSLRRIRPTKQQAHLSGQERRINLKDAFEWKGNKKIPERVLLVDDVFTTGSTMQACTLALKQAGVKTVWGWSLARG